MIAAMAGGANTEDRAVRVWRVDLGLDAAAASELRRHLSPEEIERVERLGPSDVGRRWLAGRAALREILAAELGVAPASVPLRVGDHGRPRLDDGAADLDFNLSHSADLALVAVAHGMRVGIDVERQREGRDPLRIADRYFSPAEVAAVRAFPARERPHAFLRYWTAKEALAKGLGLGLKVPSGELELVRLPGGAMAPVRRAQEWRLVVIDDLPAGYCATLAVDDEEATVAMLDWIPADAG